ncbi:MAG TPA: PDZ domain-containing protein [Pyrinomonadaceae bacterium]|nr:PDZ domain-containing protein [Pyrinomonadaceae bacterium]
MSTAADLITCSNCHSRMPSDLRFCRNCGFRLADAMGAYTGGPLAEAGSAGLVAPKKRRRLSGMAWVFIALIVFFVGAAAFTAIISPRRASVGSGTRAPVAKSYIGIDEFRNTDEGVIINAVTAPDGPADKAGLVGGDVVLKFDGQPIQNEDQLDDLMEKTPVGKTVEIEYLRDGEKKTTKLTTISRDEFRRVSTAFERRPEGRPHFGYEDGDSERVPVPGTNIYGVRLGTILRSRPADIAGIKEEDIVIEFDGVPIRTSDEFLMRVRRALPYSTVNLVIMRPGVEGEKFERIEIPVKLGKQ